MSSIQPTNEVVYFKLRLNTDVLDQTEQEILPLLSMVLTCMGAGDKTYREMDTLMELHTGLYSIVFILVIDLLLKVDDPHYY